MVSWTEIHKYFLLCVCVCVVGERELQRKEIEGRHFHFVISNITFWEEPAGWEDIILEISKWFLALPTMCQAGVLICILSVAQIMLYKTQTNEALHCQSRRVNIQLTKGKRKRRKKRKECSFQKPSWKPEYYGKDLPQGRWLTKAPPCFFELVYFAWAQWAQAIKDLTPHLTGKGA